MSAPPPPVPPAKDLPAQPPQRLGEEWLFQIAGSIDEMLWVWDPRERRVSYGNPAFATFWKVGDGAWHAASGPATGPWDDKIHPGDRARVKQLRTQTGSGQPFEYRVTRPDGRTAWLRERALPIHSPAGELLRVTHIASDVSWQMDTTARLSAEITRRTDAERDLSDLSARLKTLIDTANDAVVTIDEQSVVIDWNSTAEKMFGWSRAEALGQVLTDMIVPHVHRHSHHHGLTHYLISGEGPIFNRRVETTALRKNGEEFDVELSVWPVRSGDSHTFSSFVRDISRRKAAERALAESEAKYRTVVENVSEGILVTAAGRILYANRRALELTGLDEETAKSRPFIEFIHPDDRQRVLNNHLARLRGETVENHYQFRVMPQSGDVRWLEISAVVFDWQGQPATLNFLIDVTLKRQVEQEIRSALERERELSELKSRFVAVTSHEFRTPLAAILSSVELLDDFGGSFGDAERKEISQLIKNAVLRMNGMIEQVLLMSRLEAGSLPFAPQPVALGALLAQIAAEVARGHADSARMALLGDGIDAPRLLDERLVRHIVANLLGNALKYSAPGTPVALEASAQGEWVHLCFVDEGIGIPEADLPHLFGTFHRGANVGNIPGTGLGLNVVKECVELHGGRISVHSRPAQGTRFDVQLHAPLA